MATIATTTIDSFAENTYSNTVPPTPLIRSPYFSSSSRDVYLKLECLHPSHSFKYRGQTAFVQHALRTRGPNVHVVIASGGNAGLACACAANALNVRCTVYLPVAATKTTINLLKRQNAEVVIVGQHYSEALAALRKAIANDPNAVDAPAYDHPILWESQSEMIKEVYVDMKQVKPAAIVCSVGGGSMLGGVMIGCRSVGWGDVPLITVETVGSNCFYHTMQLNRRTNHALPSEFTLKECDGLRLAVQNRFHSVASGSLGASQAAPGVVKMALEWKGTITCVSIPDGLALQTLLRFADEHKLLVEPSCASSLSMVHRPDLLNKLVHQDGPIVVIVCGGFKVSMADLPNYAKMVGTDRISTLSVLVDGKETVLSKL